MRTFNGNLNAYHALNKIGDLNDNSRDDKEVAEGKQ